MIKLVCPECQRENEPERIYCHDCGARLDRSTLAKVAPKQEDPGQTQKRLKQMLDPGRIKMRLLFFKISKVILGAAVVAMLIEFVLPPNDLPEPVKDVELQQITLEIENAIETHSTAPLQFTETQVNTFLINVSRTRKTTLNKYLKFERAVVKFDEGVCRVTIERSIFGFSVFTSTSYNVSLQDGTLTASPVGGRIGRMPIHPTLMKPADFLFSDLWGALDREKKLVTKMGAIEFHPQLVILTPKQKE
jgi:hypothetical protein